MNAQPYNMDQALEENARLKATICDLEKQLADSQQEVKDLLEQLKLLQAKHYGPSKDQAKEEAFFDESEADEEAPEPEAENEGDEQKQEEESPAVRRGKRDPLPNTLPVRRVNYELSEEERQGPDGEVFEPIGQEVTQQLNYIPARLEVVEYIQIKYAVKGREELGIRCAKKRKRLLEKIMVTEGTLAHLLEMKFNYHIPYYRQEQMWADLGVTLPRQTLCRWTTQIGEQLEALIGRQLALIKSHHHIHADETPVTTLKEESKPGKSAPKGYMWVYLNHLGVVYDYQPGRGSKYPAMMLEGFTGYLQTDAYSGYNACEGVTHVGCMAHARRKFMDVLKVSGKKGSPGVAGYVVNVMKKLYHIEKMLKDREASPEEVRSERNARSLPKLLELKARLDEVQERTPPNGLLGKAIQYTLNNWKSLVRYVEDGELSIDNNAAERAIKPFVLGRKNWLFHGHTKGAQASARIYSLIQSAKQYNLSIHEYLEHVLKELPEAKTDADLDELLPHYYAQRLAERSEDGGNASTPSG